MVNLQKFCGKLRVFERGVPIRDDGTLIRTLKLPFKDDGLPNKDAI